ncbi:ABC transporter ATP-binding protein [Paenibacillus albicereus]|uniref:ABC transporter ATP-binding protein n=1 Tax=Paenibacillus albicereus TaxID=2726185 RepID=A0A6H2H0V7_9BACL|nr:ABC transporter ATP-binding protein [Paenibacillus albicereus]QJC53287.1 ABC transporter ATP-binding protein [Paenibacillus albicereus]
MSIPKQGAPVLQVDRVRKKLGGRQVIEDISFTIQEGEVVGFLGPNGTGKTTTIRMITGLIRPNSGQILIRGSDIRTQFSQAMSHIGAIVEQPALYEHLSGWENLMQAARIAGKPISKERMEACIALVHLQTRIGEKVKRYSLGMKQRLAIAQALLASPSLLVLDEPTNGLDPAGIIEMREVIRELCRQTGVAVFISSHLLSEIEQLCTRVLIIENGRIQASKNLLRHEEEEVGVSLFCKPEQRTSALGLLREMGLQPELAGDRILIRLMEEDLPGTVNNLYVQGVPIYRVETAEQTLEQFFLSSTTGKGTC